MNQKKTGIVKDERYLNHFPGFGHVESPERLKAIYARLDEEDATGLYRTIEPMPASMKELEWNHTRKYVERIKATDGKELAHLDPDTSTSKDSWQAAILAAGGILKAMELIHNGEIKNAIALVRPPGHHAERDKAMGFCLFNNVAIGAYYAKNVLGLKRILIVDWDLHHGNGTQNSFYEDKEVLYISTHQFPHYPGTGRLDQTGTGHGVGYTVNIPLYPGAGDEVYAAIFRRIIIPIAKAYSPEFILVSAGFDTYYQDPLGGMRCTEKGFAYFTRCLLDIAEECCQGRAIFCLEGGYSLKGLRDGVYSMLRECAGESILTNKELGAFDNADPDPEMIENILRVQQKFWPV